MANFIGCSIKQVKYRGCLIQNNPVNIDLCKSLEKGKYAVYPDNNGLPSIRFKGCDVKWVYESEAERDREFQLILKGGLGYAKE